MGQKVVDAHKAYKQMCDKGRELYDDRREIYEVHKKIDALVGQDAYVSLFESICAYKDNSGEHEGIKTVKERRESDEGAGVEQTGGETVMDGGVVEESGVGTTDDAVVKNGAEAAEVGYVDVNHGTGGSEGAKFVTEGVNHETGGEETCATEEAVTETGGEVSGVEKTSMDEDRCDAVVKKHGADESSVLGEGMEDCAPKDTDAAQISVQEGADEVGEGMTETQFETFRAAYDRMTADWWRLGRVSEEVKGEGEGEDEGEGASKD